MRLYKILFTFRKNVSHSDTDWSAPKVRRFVLLRVTELVLGFECSASDIIEKIDCPTYWHDNKSIGTAVWP